MKKFMSILSVLFACALLFASCGGDEKDPSAGGADADFSSQSETKEGGSTMSSTEFPVLTITMADGSVITAELYPDVAPNTVNNFISLANAGFYDGTIFHRVIPGFMIQGGDPEGTGYGGPDYAIKGEFTANGFENSLEHTRGVLSMARSQANDSAGSQFFIMVDDAPHLDGQYAAFGKVTSGMETVDAIVAVDTDENDKPLTDQVMKTVRVDTKGVAYPEPETIPG